MDQLPAVTDPNLFVVSVLGALVLGQGAVLFYLFRMFTTVQRAAVVADQVNNAVNNVETGEVRIYQMVKELAGAQREFDQKGWRTLPADLNNAAALTSTVRALQNDSTHISAHLDRIEAKIDAHVMWEETQKYLKGTTQ